MRGPSAPPFRRIRHDTLSVTALVNGVDPQVASNVSLDGVFRLDLSVVGEMDSLHEMAGQDPSAQLDLVVQIRSDNLKIRHVLHTERIVPGTDNRLTYSAELPGAVYHAGSQLRACICATVPSPVDELGCSSTGGVLWETDLPLSRKSNAPVLPIEFVEKSEESTQTWTTDFNGVKSNDLDTPATGAIRVYIANGTPLSAALRSATTSTEFTVAAHVIAFEVSIDAVVHVLSDDELLETIESGLDSRPDWLKDEGSIGYFLATLCSRARGAQSLQSLQDQFRSDPNQLRQILREKFVRW